ncbi:tRNA-wybutosine modification methyltransferase TYW3 [Caldisphaera sp.]|uniref:tRNA-wybutosine modification methyltransferase TYW3 n=1 Tax=Caldisphaera sp. TaxID=2060322 RepID=UPI003D1010AE
MSMLKKIDEILKQERIIGYLDPHAEEFILELNGEKFGTSSSCLGRITIIEGKWPWERDKSRIVYKSHEKISIYNIANVISRPFNDLWLKVTGPIIHIRTERIDCALNILNIARISGFKHSGIISSSDNVFTVELMSAVQITMPLKINDTFVFSKESLNEIINKANDALDEGHRRLRKLTKMVKEDLIC